MKSPSLRTGHLLLTLSCVIVVGIIVWWLSPLAMMYLLTDGLVALGIMFAATTFGMWFVPLFFPGQPLALRWHLIIGAGLGAGLLSLSMLALGGAGLLHRPVIVGGLLVLGAAGLARLLILLIRHQACLMPEDRLFDEQPQGQRFNPVYMLLLGLMPFLAMALLAATVALTSTPASSYTSRNVPPETSLAWKVRSAAVQAPGINRAMSLKPSRSISARLLVRFGADTDVRAVRMCGIYCTKITGYLVVASEELSSGGSDDAADGDWLIWR